MGSRKFLVFFLVPSISAGVVAHANSAHTVDVNGIRSQISALEKDLLASKETQASASSQLKKIRKLLLLQQEEIALSRTKVSELNASMSELSGQKQALLGKIEKQKVDLKKKLREMHRLSEADPLDASWLRSVDADNQKAYFLTKTLKKDLASVERFKEDVNAALSLELRILEEKNKLDYYVQDLESQMSLLSANEQIQREILKTNRSSRLEVLRQVRALKESEREIERMLSMLKPQEQDEQIETRRGLRVREELVRSGAAIDVGLGALKGKLPLPVIGQLLSGFGKSYNRKTNLLTFQKGITLSANPSAEVKAVAAGKAVFAGPLNNYGLIAIVEHPGRYYTLYGQMGAVAVQTGAMVAQGEVVGRTSGEPFYFEIRNKNIAINPLQWFLNSSITLTKH